MTAKPSCPALLLALVLFTCSAALTAQTSYTFTAPSDAFYRVNGGGFSNAANPTITMTEGQVYVFNNQSSGHPLRIGTSTWGSVYSGSDVVYTGPQVSGAANFGGQITFTPTSSTPRSLVYYCILHPSMMGTIIIQAPAMPPPTIDAHPQSTEVVAGQTLVLSVSATSSEAPSYTWRHGTTVLADQTGATLTINHVTSAEAGSYTVTVSNSGGETPSSAATVTVLAPPLALLAEPVAAGGSVLLRIPESFPRQTYAFEAAATLHGPWSPVASGISGTGDAIDHTEPATDTHRFFRAVVQY